MTRDEYAIPILKDLLERLKKSLNLLPGAVGFRYLYDAEMSLAKNNVNEIMGNLDHLRAYCKNRPLSYAELAVSIHEIMLNIERFEQNQEKIRVYEREAARKDKEIKIKEATINVEKYANYVAAGVAILTLIAALICVLSERQIAVWMVSTITAVGGLSLWLIGKKSLIEIVRGWFGKEDK